MYVARAGLFLFRKGSQPIRLDMDMLRIFENPELDSEIEKKTGLYPSTPFVMEIEYESTREDRGRIAVDMCEKAVTILRLFKEGHVFSSVLDVVWDKNSSPENGVFGRRIYEGLEGLGDNYLFGGVAAAGALATRHSQYSISEQEISSLEHHLRELMPLDMGFCNIAVRRFNSSYQRMNHADRLLDLLIAFEALLSDDPQAIGYKIALRCAMLLSGSLPQMEDDFHFLKRIYDTRSKIVHGILRDAIEKDCDRVESLLRRTILRLLHLWKDGKKVKSTNIDTFLFFSSRPT